MNEIQLIQKLRDQDPDALFYLYNEYRDRVLAVVKRIIRDDWDAEEVTQDVFWTVHRKIHLFREDSALWSWMYRIAINAAKMRVRKYKRYPIPLEDELLRDLCSNQGSDDPMTRPDEQLDCKQLVEDMTSYLDGVSQINRDLYISMEFDGLSKEEVAEDLDLTVPAVKTRLHRVRVGLRSHLADRYEEVRV